jgi:D-proline reductase (dithiol) PrdB
LRKKTERIPTDKEIVEIMRFFYPSRLNRKLGTLVFGLPSVQRLWAGRYRAIESNDVPWTPLRKPLPLCRVALVTTAGVHLKTDPPFDMSDPKGDPSYRVIPATNSPDDLTITHDYYDHRDADRDINVVFPIGILRQLQAERRIGPSGPDFYSLMGHIEEPHLRQLTGRTAPELAARLKDEEVDIAIFTPA